MNAALINQTTPPDRIQKSFPCSWSILQVSQGDFTGLVGKALPIYLVWTQLCISYSETAQKAYLYLADIPNFLCQQPQWSMNTTFWVTACLPIFQASPKTAVQLPIWLCLSGSFLQLQFSYSFGLKLFRFAWSPAVQQTDCVQYLTENYTDNPILLYFVLWTTSVLLERAIW